MRSENSRIAPLGVLPVEADERRIRKDKSYHASVTHVTLVKNSGVMEVEIG